MAKDAAHGRALDIVRQLLAAHGVQGSVDGVLDVVWTAKGGDAGVGSALVELLDHEGVTPSKKLDTMRTLLELRGNAEMRRAKDPKPTVEMGDMADMAAALQILLKNLNAVKDTSSEIRTADEPGRAIQADPALGTADDT